jgi:hypothetical protein
MSSTKQESEQPCAETKRRWRLSSCAYVLLYYSFSPAALNSRSLMPLGKTNTVVCSTYDVNVDDGGYVGPAIWHMADDIIGRRNLTSAERI